MDLEARTQQVWRREHNKFGGANTTSLAVRTRNVWKRGSDSMAHRPLRQMLHCKRQPRANILDDLARQVVVRPAVLLSEWGCAHVHEEERREPGVGLLGVLMGRMVACARRSSRSPVHTPVHASPHISAHTSPHTSAHTSAHACARHCRLRVGHLALVVLMAFRGRVMH